MFGVLVKPDPYGAGDVLHDRLQPIQGLVRADKGYVGQSAAGKSLLRGKDRARGLVALVQSQLKKLNFQNYETLWEAFQDYDKDKSGFVEKHELKAACAKAGFELEEPLLDDLVKQVGADADGKLDFKAFVNFLNWKDYLHNGKPGEEYEKVGNVPKSIDPAPFGYETSAGKIKSTIGGAGFTDTRDWRRYGVPTVRSDIPAPRLRRVSDKVNYGDQADMYGLIHPSVYATRGIHERDFFKARSKAEIFDLFSKIGVKMNEDAFGKTWDKAKELSPAGEVSVESFRTALDQHTQENMG